MAANPSAACLRVLLAALVVVGPAPAHAARRAVGAVAMGAIGFAVMAGVSYLNNNPIKRGGP